MSPKWSCFTAVVLFALLRNASSYPGCPDGTDDAQSLAVTAATISREAFLAACPHSIFRLATDAEVSGVWYGLEILQDVTRRQHADACWQYNITVVGDRLSLHINFFRDGLLNQTEFFSLSRGPREIWKNNDELFDDRTIFGISSTSSLLVMCQIDTGNLTSVRTALLGRSPETSEQQLLSTHGLSAATTKRFLFNLQNCFAPPSSEPQVSR